MSLSPTAAPPSADAASDPPLFSLAASARKLAPGLALTLLVIIAIVGGKPFARVARDGCSLFGSVTEIGARHDGLALAAQWGRQLALDATGVEPLLAAEFGDGALAIADCVRVLALPVIMNVPPVAPRQL